LSEMQYCCVKYVVCHQSTLAMSRVMYIAKYKCGHKVSQNFWDPTYTHTV